MNVNVLLRRVLFVVSLGAILSAPLRAAAAVRPLFNLDSVTQSPSPSNRFTVLDFQQLTALRVNLPFPDCAVQVSDCQDVTLLNQLDGFSAQPRLSIPFDGPIDPASVTSDSVFLVRVDLSFFHSAPIGINQVVWDPATLTLFVQPDDHLQQNTTYLLAVTDDVRDATGSRIQSSDAFRRMRRRDDSSGERTDWQGLVYRRVLADVLQLADSSLRRNIVAASLFTTGSVTSTLEKIRDQIKASPAPAVNFQIGAAGELAVFPLSSISAIAFGRQVTTAGPLNTTGVPTPALNVFPGAVGSIAFGKFAAKNFETAGAFIPAVPTRTGVPAVQSTQDLYFNLILPAGVRPAAGWPVAIFGHGFGDNKNNSPLVVASTLAANGIATISINAVGHGFGAGGTLTVLRVGAPPVVLPAGGRGVDVDGNGAIDATEGLFAVPPRSLIGTRDGLQQTVADLMQLVRAIQGGVDVDGTGRALDASRIYYFGQSLGGIYGTVFLGAEPAVRDGVVNVPGGPVTDAARISPGFRPLAVFLLASRVPSLLNLGGGNFNDNMPLRNQPPLVNTVVGAINIQTYVDRSNWLGQAGDPVSWAAFIRRTPLRGSVAKSVIVQMARGDATVPNPTTTALVRSGDLADRTTMFRNDLAFALGAGFGKNPHTFLTNIAGAALVARVAVGAQIQIATFFATDGALTIDPDGAGPLFETPIQGALPEDTAFIP